MGPTQTCPDQQDRLHDETMPGETGSKACREGRFTTERGTETDGSGWRGDTYGSGVPGEEDVAVQLGVHAARVVGDEGELGVDRSGGGQGDPTQGVGHQEGLQETPPSGSIEPVLSNSNKNQINKGSPFHPRHIFLAL